MTVDDGPYQHHLSMPDRPSLEEARRSFDVQRAERQIVWPIWRAAVDAIGAPAAAEGKFLAGEGRRALKQLSSVKADSAAGEELLNEQVQLNEELRERLDQLVEENEDLREELERLRRTASWATTRL
jgi:hypothetical protein